MCGRLWAARAQHSVKVGELSALEALHHEFSLIIDSFRFCLECELNFDTSKVRLPRFHLISLTGPRGIHQGGGGS
jgi:hypothetical protein